LLAVLVILVSLDFPFALLSSRSALVFGFRCFPPTRFNYVTLLTFLTISPLFLGLIVPFPAPSDILA